MIMNTLKKLFKDESGATAIEYGLIVALISIVVIIALQTVGTNLTTAYTTVGTELSNANTTGN
jgi:pilus assembly protein Flp/PilA